MYKHRLRLTQFEGESPPTFKRGRSHSVQRTMGLLLRGRIQLGMGLPKIVDSLTVTDSYRKEAKRRGDSKHGDADMGRDEDEQAHDANVGMLGEVVFEEMIRQTDDLSVTPASTPQFDYKLNGQKVEVKTRKTWDYSNPDLLVRTKFDLAARYYVQIDMHTQDNQSAKPDLSNVVEAELVGFVKANEVETYGEHFSPPNKSTPTLMVPRQYLHPMHELHAMTA